MGNVVPVDFGQTNPPCPPAQYADVISIVGELEPAHPFAVLSNALFAVLLATIGFIAPSDARTAICMAWDTKLRLEGMMIRVLMRKQG
jgi:hypothetical protein